MELSHTDIKPDHSRKPFFDSDDLDSSSYKIVCAECGKDILASCRSIYKGAWKIDWQFSDEEEALVNEFYCIGSRNVSLTRGWPSLTKHKCLDCGTNYVLVANFHEYRNSVYQIVIQGVARVKT